MEFWYNKDDYTIEVPQMDGTKLPLYFKKVTETPNLDTIYASTGACLQNFSNLPEVRPLMQHISNKENRDAIYSMENFPYVINHPYYDRNINEYEFSHDKHIPNNTDGWVPYKPKLTDRILILNGVGTGLGDGMVGIRALQIFEEETGVRPELASVSMVMDQTHKLMYSTNGYIQRPLPITLRELCEYDAIVDFSALAIQSGFNTLNFIDFYLYSLGIDPKTISDERKQNKLKSVDPILPQFDTLVKDLKSKGKKLIGLKIQSSTPIRSLDREKLVDYIIEVLKYDKKYHVILFDNDPKIPRQEEFGNKYKTRFHIVGGTDYHQMINMIEVLDGLITVDTCFYHIANSFNVPTLVLFTTIDPKLRINYYPNCTGIEICKDSKFAGKHLSIDPVDATQHFDNIKNFKLTPHLHNLRG